MVALSQKTSAGPTLKSFKAINVLITVFPDRLIVKYLGMLSKLTTSELRSPDTIMLRDIASIEQCDIHDTTHGMRQLVIHQKDHSESVYVLYSECAQHSVTELINAITAYQQGIAPTAKA
jgi:hypothetical protein